VERGANVNERGCRIASVLCRSDARFAQMQQ
jgi:hypothetical protein